MKKVITNVIIFVVLILLTMWLTHIPNVDSPFYTYPSESFGFRLGRVTSHPDLPFVLITSNGWGGWGGFPFEEIIFMGVFFEYYLNASSSGAHRIFFDTGVEYSLTDALSMGLITIHEAIQSGLNVNRRVSPNPEFIFWLALLLVFAYAQISKLIDIIWTEKLLSFHHDIEN